VLFEQFCEENTGGLLVVHVCVFEFSERQRLIFKSDLDSDFNLDLDERR